MAKKKTIPIFDQHKAAKAGFFIKSLSRQSLDDTDHDIVSAHRDEVYMLFVLRAGFCRAIIDFEECTFVGPSFCLIHPEQVHGLVDYGTPEGWMIAFDPSLLTQETRQLITRLTVLSIPDHQLDSLHTIYTLSDLLWQLFWGESDTTHQPLTLHYLLNALITTIASLYQTDQNIGNQPDSRGDEITRAFNQLLKVNFIDWKRPAQYAQALHLSVNHLNDTVRQKTGYSVSYWIQYQTILESKRLLYHTRQTVKEVAHQLGFEDQHYFSRLFRKVTGQTPRSFRQPFRDLSIKSPY